MAGAINLQPQTLDLSLYAGDGVKFRLICTDDAQAPIDVSGATEAQVKIDRLEGTPALVSFVTDMTNAISGIIELSLTGADTQLLVADPSSKNGKFTGVWDLQWTPTGEEPRTICQGKVECLADVTRP
jgi:hypothetical protein